MQRELCWLLLLALLLLAAAPGPTLSLTAQPAEVLPGTAVRATVALHADGQSQRPYDVQITADDLQIVEAWSASGSCHAVAGGVSCQVLAGAGAPAAIVLTGVALPSCDGRARLTATSDGSRAAQIVEIGGPRRCVLWLPLMAND